MTRFFLLFGLRTSLLFALFIGVLRAHSYDASALRAFLTPPDDCPMPCWQGIRPGVTNINDALHILEAHPWISEIQHPEIPYDKRTYWNWNAEPSGVINNAVRGHGLPDWDNNAWSSIEISTVVPMGDFVLTLGKPDGLMILAIRSNSIAGGSAQVEKMMPVLVYRDLGLMIYNFIDCPARMDDFWNSWGMVVYGDAELAYPGQVYRFEKFVFPDWFFVNAPDVGCM